MSLFRNSHSLEHFRFGGWKFVERITVTDFSISFAFKDVEHELSVRVDRERAITFNNAFGIARQDVD